MLQALSCVEQWHDPALALSIVFEYGVLEESNESEIIGSDKLGARAVN